MTPTDLPVSEPPLPHVLAPVAGESLISFMGRLDRANDWSPGTVDSMVLNSPGSGRKATAVMWASGGLWDLRRLAAITLNPLAAVDGLTLLPDLRAAINEPNAFIRSLGTPDSLRFCHECLADTGTVPRFCLLPRLAICPVHEEWLASFCSCRRGSTPSLTEGGKVVCSVCRRALGWAAVPPTAEEIGHARDVWRAWRYFLGWRGDDVRARGYRTVRSTAHNYPLRKYPLRYLTEGSSLERFVLVFTTLRIDPALIGRLEDPPDPPCPNATCPRFKPPGPNDPLSSGRQVERHCAHCGARFAGRRILLCFDFGHGGRLPSERAVRKAQHRLARWRVALADACREAILDGTPITVGRVFRQAGVPMNANLRAERLGLVAQVQDAARRQRLLEGREPVGFRDVTMVGFRLLAHAADQGDWRTCEAVASLALGFPGRAASPDAYLYRRHRAEAAGSGALDPAFSPAWMRRTGRSPDDVARLARSRAARSSFWDEPLSAMWRGIADDVAAGHSPRTPVTPRFTGPVAWSLTAAQKSFPLSEPSMAAIAEIVPLDVLDRVAEPIRDVWRATG